MTSSYINILYLSNKYVSSIAVERTNFKHYTYQQL